MTGLQEIAHDMGITKQAVALSLKKGLSKVWSNLGKLYPDISPFERMIVLAEFCNINHPDEWPHFFYGMPTDIRKEVLEDAAKNMKIDDINSFLGRDFKKRMNGKQK